MAWRIPKFWLELESSLERSHDQKGNENEDILSKKLILRTAVSNVIMLGLFVPIFWYLQLRLWFYLGIIYCLFFLIIALLFIWLQKGIKWFSLAIQLFLIFFSLFNVVATGGIMHSGGAVFIGLGAVSFMVGPDRIRRANFMLGLYLVSIFLEILVQPYFSPILVLSDELNTIFFIIHFSIVIVVFYSFIQISRKMEQQLRFLENEKLRALNSAKTTFFTNISHEFRTPLTVIMGMVDQIREDPQKWYNEGLTMIKRNSEELLGRVTQILDLSKLDEAVMPVNYVRGDIIPYLKYLVDSVRSVVEMKQLGLRFESNVLALEMDYDEDKLQRIMSNLLSNAIKNTGAGGSIRISIDEKTNAENPRDTPNGSDSHYLQIGVIDTGVGIPAKNLPRIFDRFYKGGGHIAPVEGTGLGLAIVKELVTLLKGQVTVSSVSGQGTAFTVCLPVFPEPHQENRPAHTSADHHPRKVSVPDSFAQPGEGPLVLIVEDNHDVVVYLKAIMLSRYQILIAVDGKSGIDLARKEMPDLIISDVMMPHQDGFELCHTLKTDIKTSHIPVILLTARADSESRLKGLEKGADAYMSKPFTKKELLIRIAQQIRLRKTLQEKYMAMAFTFSDSERPKDLDEAFLADLSKVLKHNYQDPEFDVSAFCDQIGLSRSQLHKKLRSLTGKSTTEIIRSFRLLKAHELITTTKMTISQIAYETGFNDPAYFSRTFVKEFQRPPSELRSTSFDRI